MITLVVFSKDRALQCDSLLRSVKDHCTGIDKVNVIAYASTALQENAYFEMAHEAPFTELRMQVGDPLGKMIDRFAADSDHVALAVDDQLFYAPSDFKKAVETLDEHLGFVWSWRLGHDPEFTESCSCVEGCYEHWLTTSFTHSPDYSYLWHSDGALYKTSNYVSKLDMYLPDWRTGVYTPNDLEAAVVARKSRWAISAGPHLGPLSPTCITWQLNRVQTKYGSPATEIPETNVDALAKAYLAGKRVNNDALYGALAANPLRWNPPGARPTHVYACEEASRYWASCVR